jgi:hypothetical protein
MNKQCPNANISSSTNIYVLTRLSKSPHTCHFGVGFVLLAVEGMSARGILVVLWIFFSTSAEP